MLSLSMIYMGRKQLKFHLEHLGILTHIQSVEYLACEFTQKMKLF